MQTGSIQVRVTDLQSWRRCSIAFMVMTLILTIYGGFSTYQWSGAAADRDFNAQQAKEYFTKATNLTETNCGRRPAERGPWHVTSVRKVS